MPADVKYLVSAILDVSTKGGKKAATFANGLVNAGNNIQRMGGSIRGMLGSTAALLGLVGGAYGIYRVVQGAIDANREIENLNQSIATTFQLFGRNAGAVNPLTGQIEGLRSESEQFARNLADAAVVTDKLFRIAAASPASFQQAQKLFDNLVPGIIQVETSLDKIMGFTKKALAVGTLLKGDFKQAGADLRRMLTGQAGSDVRAWSEGLSEAVRKTAGTMGKEFQPLNKLFAKDLTKAFNKLTAPQRYQLLNKSISRMGIATESAGKTWDGLTSAIRSGVFLLRKALGESMFGAMKERFKKMMSDEGIANPMSKAFARLELGAKVAGVYLADAGMWILDKLERGADYLANNWKDIYHRLQKAFDTGMKVAKLFMAAKAAQFVMGGATKMAGRGVQAGQGVFGAAKAIAPLVGAIGGVAVASIFALPVVALLAAAFVGLGVAVGGAAAWFIENWRVLLTGFQQGVLQVQPLTNALGHLWAKMVALGESILGAGGASDATGVMNRTLLTMASLVHAVTGAMAFFLRTAGVVQVAWNVITMGLKSIGAGFAMLVDGILRLIRGAASTLPNINRKLIGRLDKAITYTEGTAGGLFAGLEKDARDARQFFELAEAFEAAFDEQGTYAKSLEDALSRAVESAQKGFGATDKSDTDGKLGPGNVVIHSLKIEMDLRDKDPDRVMGAFTRKLQRVTAAPTQAVTHEDYGV